MRRFSGKNVLVTGAAGNIGRAIVRQFVKDGAAVALVDMQEEAGAALTEELRNGGARAEFVVADITSSAQVDEALKKIHDKLGSLHILVNNAGNFKGESFDDTDMDAWQWDMDLNLAAHYRMVCQVLPQLREHKQSAIVNISSVNALMALGNPAYSAAKAGLVSLTHGLATEYMKYGVRTNAVLPGTIQTDAWNARIGERPDVLEKVKAWYPGGKVGMPEDVAHAVTFLASDEARFINGASLVVDGGLTVGNSRMLSDITGSSS